MNETSDTKSKVPEPTRKSTSILSKVLIVLVIIVLLLVGLIAMQPNDFHVERSTTMAAPASAIFPEVNNFHNWEAWSPWAKLDPAAKNSFEGPDSGEGAVFRWDGNDEVGAGSMTIIESKPDELVRIRLDFTRPFEDTSTTEIALASEGDQTKVTWSMYGQNNFISKAFCLIMNMDQMIGEYYERGLANLQQIVKAKQEKQDADQAEEDAQGETTS